MKNLNFWLARKLLLSKKEIGFISWSGFISIVGVSVGCLAIILSIAVLNGFEREIRQRIIGFETDFRLLPNSPNRLDTSQLEPLLQDIEGIEQYSFFLERKGIVISGKDRSLVWIKAVQDSFLSDVYQVGKVIVLEQKTKLPLAHLGKGIANRLGVQVGDTLRLLNPIDSQVYLGFPLMVRVVVGSVFQINLLDFDDRYCFIPLEVGRRLFRKQTTFDGVDIRLSQVIPREEVEKSLNSQLPKEVRLVTWEGLHETLFSAMRMEKLGSIVVLSLIILVASFNIASTLIMLVMEKVREIGILRTIGATKERIRKIFALQGIMIGGVGLLIGLVFGLFFILAQRYWGLISLPKNIYFTESLPVLISWMDIMIVILIGSLLIGLFVIYPALVASRLLPREAIQYEK